MKAKTLGRRDLKKVITMVTNTLSHEIDCGECLSHMEIFAEEKLQGLAHGEATTLVKEHLDRCMDCREEFSLLMKSLKSLKR